MSSQTIQSKQPDPKKRNWLYFIMFFPLASVFLSSIMIYHAVNGKDSLVSDNYYKDGLDINQTIGQDRLAKKLAVRAYVSIDAEGNALIDLKSLAKTKEPFVTLKLVHPTLGERDSVTKFLPTAEGPYVAEVPENLSGNWYLDLYAHDESWRVRQKTSLPTENYLLAP